ncbi:chromate efflux transporter [Desertibaculum subflavum]|uniref:chromate efflux transporter n=1 Tax=Desertibaculum subflavum TaxID=2268458 RepID=UPI000E66E140
MQQQTMKNTTHWPPVSFGEATRLWLKVGLLSFGGPAGQIALMHKLVVEERRWIGETRFLHALNYCMLLPGPEAQQLATYIGWLMHRTWGGIVAGGLFVLPGAIVMLALSTIYATLGEVPLVQAVFFGVKAAVLAVVIEAVLRIGKRALKNAAMYTIAAAAFIGIFFLEVPFPIIVLGAGVVGLIGGRLAPDRFVVIKGHGEGDAAAEPMIDIPHTHPSAARALAVLAVALVLWLGPVLVLWTMLGSGDVFTQVGLFFSKMAVVTFGGAYAVLAYVAQQAVETYGWLNPGEMLDGLGLAETTPGPLILVLQFVGYLAAFRAPGALDPLVAGTLGAVLTIWVTFLPSFLWIFLGAPYVERLHGRPVLGAALSAITAAVVGVVLNLAIWFGLHMVFGRVQEVHAAGLRLLVPDWATLDLAALALAVAALIAMLRFKLGMLTVLGAAAALGIGWKFTFGG